MVRESAGYYKQNLLQQLRGFCYAAAAGSISKAAHRMALSQPSVSLQIQALEREFQTTLFERRGPRITLTPEGKLLHEMASPLVDGMDALQESFQSHRDRVDVGELDIAAGQSTLLYLLPRYVGAFAERCPGIDLRLHNVTGRTGLRMLRAGEVDLAVGSMIDVPDDILYCPLVTYDPTLITPLKHPLTQKKKITLRDIAAHPLIVPPRQLTTWRIVDSVLKQRRLTYRVGLEVGGWELIKKYVELGRGVAIVTSICLTGDERLAAFSMTRYFPRRTYGIVLRRGSFLSPHAKVFVETMAADASAHLFAGDGRSVSTG